MSRFCCDQLCNQGRDCPARQERRIEMESCLRILLEHRNCRRVCAATRQAIKVTIARIRGMA